VKICFIAVKLVPEAKGQSNEEIEKQIFHELSENITAIAWGAEILKITALEIE